jgi:hypothetical protein
MRVLLLRPVPANERFGLGPFFRIEPLGMEYIAAALERHALFQAGFTILTPLPGTDYFDKMRPVLRPRRWSDFDMHHLLWQPALGAERFFELYCETWRRSVLNLRGRKRVWKWPGEVDLRNAVFLLRALRRTQHMMDPARCLAECDCASPPSSFTASFAADARRSLERSER